MKGFRRIRQAQLHFEQTEAAFSAGLCPPGKYPAEAG